MVFWYPRPLQKSKRTAAPHRFILSLHPKSTLTAAVRRPVAADTAGEALLWTHLLDTAQLLEAGTYQCIVATIAAVPLDAACCTVIGAAALSHSCLTQAAAPATEGEREYNTQTHLTVFTRPSVPLRGRPLAHSRGTHPPTSASPPLPRSLLPPSSLRCTAVLSVSGAPLSPHPNSVE